MQVPTTLLAQVDAGIGGKVAVDFRAGKNYVGTFYQPWLVLADLDVLGTLPAAELRSGAAEVAKYGLLAGGELWTLAASSPPAASPPARVGDELVAGCAAYKLAVVAADEREETGARAVLNLGHTVGHAVEAATSFARYSHGEAVALGLHATLRLSRELCGLDEAEEQAGHDLLDGLGLPRRLDGVDARAGVRPDVPRQEGRAPTASGTCCWTRSARRAPASASPPALEREVVEWLTRR